MTRPSAPQRQGTPAGPSTAGSVQPPRGAGARWRAFAGRYGWRAYALPLLTAVSLLAVFNIGAHRDRPAGGAVASGPTGSGAVAGTAAASTPVVRTTAPTAASSKPETSKPPARSPARPLPLPALPAGPAYTFRGQGSFATVAGASGVLGKGQLFRFTIDVENGVGDVDPKVFAATVMSALSDQRSWIASGAVALQRVDSGPVDFRITLAAPTTVRAMCGYSLQIETSCYAGSEGRVVLNVSRWVRGAQVYNGDLVNYHRYAVNHEVGHALGHNHAHNCLSNGLAPVMMQQTIGNKTASGQACRPNPWPFPAATPDAPGAEQVGESADLEFFRRNST